MAKYSKFDPRNKKQGRNKALSQDKDLKIKEADWKDEWQSIGSKRMINEVMYDDEHDHEELNNQELRG
jgi:hypothetical protein